ncbi:MAG: SusC/RagA family TonB-linked outer membrane protein, partial [Paludibacter sp.]|nr:SusC/RagA family TonB-linked outer membrane protein [Paludibacter sp.]
TMTDAEGQFTISVPQSATLVVSSVGHLTKEVAAANGVVIRLEADETMLKEVQVIEIAYGTVTRAQFVGAAAVVDGDKLLQRSTSNMTNALQGAAAGVQVVSGSGQPGTAATINIRGVGSVNGGTVPLYVIDGAPVTSPFSINLLDPHNVESMTVLKDASSTAIYGARGANGVILITTKQGSKTSTNVTVDAKWGSSSRAVPNYNTMTDPAMYYETLYKALYNSQIYSGKSAVNAFAYADANIFSQTGAGYQVYTIPDGERFIGTNFKLNPNATLGYRRGDYFYTPDNWEKETLNTGNLRQEYNVQISGGNDKTTFFISAGYLDDPGLVKGSGFSRYTINGNIDSQVKSWLKVGLNTTYAFANYQNPGYQSTWGSTGNVFFTMNEMAPIFPFYVRNADGSIKTDRNGYTVFDSGNNTGFIRPGSAPRGNNAINLLIDQNYDYYDLVSNNIYATITPLKGLSVTARITPNVSNDRAMSLSNPFYGSPQTDGAVAVEHYRSFTFNQQYIADYKLLFGEIHKIELLAGWETYRLKRQNLRGTNNHLFNPFIGELNNAFGIEPANQHAFSYTQNYGTSGAFGRLQYDLKNRYFFNATVRYEGVSRYAPNKRWGLFGSIGAAWSLSSEKFMSKTNNWLDMLKLKASYGTQGNDQILTYYAFRRLWDVAYNSAVGDYVTTLSAVGNANLTWEAQKLLNAGVEFSLFKEKLSGNVDYFRRVNSNMLFSVPMPPSSGFSSEPQNGGSVANSGVEIELTSKLINTKNFAWTLFGNISFIKSKMLSLPDYVKISSPEGIKYGSYILKIGGSLNEAYMVKYAGVDKETGLSLYYTDPDHGDNSLTTNYADAKQSDLGDVSVDAYGGFGTSIYFYGFDLGAQFAYQFGGKAYDGTYQELMHTGKQSGRNWHLDILNAWTPTNTNTDIPRINSADDINQQNSSRFLTSTNFVSLNSLTLGYNIPARYLEKLQISSLRVYVTGDNLALFSARKGFDPRQSQNLYLLDSGAGVAGSTTSGNYVYSQMRSISGGLTITF